jgi:hypothetical protein
MINIKKQDPVADVVKDILQQEALKGNQHKIDKNKNNKIDAHDFKILRGEKPEVKEGWDDMIKAGKERAERERQEMGTGKFNKQEVKPGVVRYTKKPEKYEPAEKTQKEEVEQIDELKKSTLGSYVKKATADAVISRKIGSDFEHQASRAKKASMKNASTSLSDKYKSIARKRQAGIGKAVNRLTKEEVDQVQEREMTSGETAERERIVKGMKKGFSGFRQRYGDRAKSVMYATATKQAMKEETLEEGKWPEGDTVPFVTGANTTSSPVDKIKEVAGAAMKKISKDLKTK